MHGELQRPGVVSESREGLLLSGDWNAVSKFCCDSIQSRSLRTRGKYGLNLQCTCRCLNKIEDGIGRSRKGARLNRIATKLTYSVPITRQQQSFTGFRNDTGPLEI